MNSQQFI